MLCNTFAHTSRIVWVRIVVLLALATLYNGNGIKPGRIQPIGATPSGPTRPYATCGGRQWRGQSEPALRRDLAPDRGGRGPGAVPDDSAHALEDRGARPPHGAHGLARAGHGVSACGVLCPGARHLGRPADALLTRSRLTALPCSLPQRTAAGGPRRRAYHRAIGPSTRTQQKPTPHIARHTGFSFDCHVPRAPTPSIASTRPRSHVNRHVVRNPR